jgi:hypothetical protein
MCGFFPNKLECSKLSRTYKLAQYLLVADLKSGELKVLDSTLAKGRLFYKSKETC